MKGLHGLAFILLVIGGLNWGLMGLGALMGNDLNAWNVVHMILGQWMMVENIVYLLVGLSAIYVGVGHKKDCRMCNPSGM
jgi:uncharacterized membrane protein YuzA (DUF378 family)